MHSVTFDRISTNVHSGNWDVTDFGILSAGGCKHCIINWTILAVSWQTCRKCADQLKKTEGEPNKHLTCSLQGGPEPSQTYQKSISKSWSLWRWTLGPGHGATEGDTGHVTYDCKGGCSGLQSVAGTRIQQSRQTGKSGERHRRSHDSRGRFGPDWQATGWAETQWRQPVGRWGMTSCGNF